MGEVITYAAFTALTYMTLWYFVALFRKRNDVADIAWGVGFLTVAVALFLRQQPEQFKAVILVGMVSSWGLRLALHIAIRHATKPEDNRYVEMRKKWRYKSLQAYTNVFLSQSVFLLMVASPIILYFSDPNDHLSILNIIGLLLWSIGMFFEIVGDLQLARFIKEPKNKGKIMRYGLWKYTRHPNYFGEITLWWGLWLFTGFGDDWIFGLLGPVTITVLILGISGIPMLESRYKGNKEYEKYQKTTSSFFPLPSKK